MQINDISTNWNIYKDASNEDMYLSCTILQLLENIKEREVVRIVKTYSSTDNVDKVFKTSDYSLQKRTVQLTTKVRF